MTLRQRPAARPPAVREPPGCRPLTHAEMTAAGVRYEDLVGACDAVMTKPGYGIVAECIANGTPMVYTARGRFAEYACLVAGIEAHLPNAFISNEDLRAGRWAAALEAVFAQPRRAAAVRDRRRPSVAADGVELACAATWRREGHGMPCAAARICLRAARATC